MQPGRNTERALRRILETRKDLLRNQPASDSAPDVASQEDEDLQTWLIVLDHSFACRLELEAAIRRMTDGLYGICAGCGAPIAAGRLRVFPFAVRCLPCQERCERDMQRNHGLLRTGTDN